MNLTITMAARRDASFYNRPETRTPKKWHILADGGGSRCGRCPILDDKNPVRAQTVPLISRCKKCKYWPDFNATPEVIHWSNPAV